MSSGWMVFGLIGALIIGSGFILVSAVMRAVWSQRERESLTSSDLRALEESAVMLVEELRNEADRGIAELDGRCAVLRDLIAEADRKIEALTALDRTPRKGRVGNPTEKKAAKGMNQVLELASRGLGRVEIAKTTGLDLAEVNLVLSLGGVSCN